MRRSSTPCSRQASTALRVSTSTTASWKLAATSATGTGSPDRSRASTQRATAVFRPENEKSNRCRSRSLRERESPREVDRHRAALARHAVDVRSAGERQPEHAGDLVERLTGGVVDGAAERAHVVGDVRHQQQAGVATGHQQSPSWARRAGRARRRPPRRGRPGGSRRTAGRRARRQSAFAAATPTSRAPARPGPAVTAIASRSASRTPASRQARSIVGTIASRWARLATSGTTPPNRACSSTLLATASTSSCSPRTIPTPVSSQEVSMPSTRGPSFISSRPSGPAA